MDDADKVHFQGLLRVLDKIEPWLQRTNPDTPERFTASPRSALIGDDRHLGPYQMSHAAWHALGHAVDHLHMLRSAFRDAGAIHLYAPYSLIRAAVENASVAVWLLSPTARPERIERRLRLAALDMRSGERMRKLVGAQGRKTLDERLGELAAIASAVGIDSKKALRPIGFEEIVGSAGAEVRAGDVLSRVVWRGGSGIAHGDLWATVSMAERMEMPGAPAGIANLRITADMQTLLVMTSVATELTSKGWDLLDSKARAPY